MTPNAQAAPAGSPPINSAAPATKPSARANVGRNHFDLVIRIKHLLHGAAEVASEGERQRQ
jgi:hypothetical protein